VKRAGQSNLDVRQHGRGDARNRPTVLTHLESLARRAPTNVLPKAPPIERRNNRQPVAAPMSRRSATFWHRPRQIFTLNETTLLGVQSLGSSD
jgi:hypothetical protein